VLNGPVKSRNDGFPAVESNVTAGKPSLLVFYDGNAARLQFLSEIRCRKNLVVRPTRTPRKHWVCHLYVERFMLSVEGLSIMGKEKHADEQ
jgi:hypothetical protein